jgi:TM2 domain-containing membrane protein YozV
VERIREDITVTAVNTGTAQKSWIAALLLCFFLGFLGVHRFYVGKIGTGILQIVTIGGFFGIWVLVDFIMIAIGKFSDKQGQPLAR